MKNIFKTFAFAAMAFAGATSCQNDFIQVPDAESASGTTPMTVTLSSVETKASLGADGLSVNFTGNETFTVAYYKGENGTAGQPVEGGAESLWSKEQVSMGEGNTVTLNVPNECTQAYIIYKQRSSAGYAYYADYGVSCLRAKLIATHAAVKGSFPEENNVAIGEVDLTAKTAVLKSCMALLKFAVPANSGLTEIVINGNDQYLGSFPMFSVDGAFHDKFQVKDNTKEYKLTDVDSEAAATYYIPILPTTYTSGITVTLNLANGNYITKTSKANTTLARNIIYDMNAEALLQLDPVNPNPVDPTPGNTKTFTMQFKEVVPGDNTTYNVWPFTPAAPLETDWTEGIRTEPFGPYYLKDDTAQAYPFYFYKKNFLKVFEGNKQGLDIGGQANNYLLFPPVPGMKLVKVRVVNTYAQTSGVSVTNNVVDADGNPTETVGEYTLIAKGNKATNYYDHTWNLTGTAVNTAYRLNVTPDSEGKVTTYTALGIVELTYSAE